MKKEKRKKGFWNFIKGCSVKHPVVTSAVTILVLLLVSYALLGILTFVDRKTINILPNAFTRLDGGVETWFSFYTSFIGIAASIVLGVIAYGLSVKVDKMDKLSKIREITPVAIRLYDLWRDFKPSTVQYSDLSRRFVLEIELNQFQAYYSTEIESVEWGRIGENYTEEPGNKLRNLKTYIEDGKAHIIHLYFDDIFDIEEFEEPSSEKKEKSFHYYVRQNCYNPIMKYPFQRQRYLKIHMKMTDSVSKRRPETVLVDMCIFVENGGYYSGKKKKKKKDYIQLNPKKYTINVEEL